jgi:hypothetical protein
MHCKFGKMNIFVLHPMARSHGARNFEMPIPSQLKVHLKYVDSGDESIINVLMSCKCNSFPNIGE